ncbi:thiamine phosphate synthase [Sphingobacterium sp. LRF_L2]|uniref:thiamine phosphate synthase n=1 Tax=Sphingobacterium sp. LRF_L2 TaxID=3369421 RepID=UPI003F63CBE8
MPFNVHFPYPLYLVISEKDCHPRPWLWVAEQAILGGVDIIQLREKNCSQREFLRKAIELKKITDKMGIPLVINDAVDIASEIGAWGVHVGQTDTRPITILEKYGHKFQIGWSLENLKQLQSEQIGAVQHLGVSPIYNTATKTDTKKPWGIEGLIDLREKTEKPLVAIGRMNLDTAEIAFRAGANSVAVVSAICQSEDPKAISEHLKQKLT